MAYIEQITLLLFLKMADEQTKPPYSRPPIVPPELGWPSLLAKDGDELDVHYRHILEELGRKPGMLGEIFKKARSDIQNPATLKRLIVDLIDPEQWTMMQADVKGDIYEGCWRRAQRSRPRAPASIFTPRTDPGDGRCDAAAARRHGVRSGMRRRRVFACGARLRDAPSRQCAQSRSEEAPAAGLGPRLGTRAGDRTALHHESLPARHRRRSVSHPLGARRSQPIRASASAWCSPIRRSARKAASPS